MMGHSLEQMMGAFLAAFPDRPAPDLFTITRAPAAFQRSLTGFDSPYDRDKREGDTGAQSGAAKRGEQLFFDHRCECHHRHSGIPFFDNIQTARMAKGEVGFHNTGLYSDCPAAVPGLIEITGKAQDAGRFRTPSLRNVAVAAPYMHDGWIADLRGVIAHDASAGRAPDLPTKDGIIQGFRASEAEIADLIAVRESLTDEGFPGDPRRSDPWPAGHPAGTLRQMPVPGAGGHSP